MLALLPDLRQAEIEKLQPLVGWNLSMYMVRIFLGLIYMSLSSIGSRNQTGVYYTPDPDCPGGWWKIVPSIYQSKNH